MHHDSRVSRILREARAAVAVPMRPETPRDAALLSAGGPTVGRLRPAMGASAGRPRPAPLQPLNPISAKAQVPPADEPVNEVLRAGSSHNTRKSTADSGSSRSLLSSSSRADAPAHDASAVRLDDGSRLVESVLDELRTTTIVADGPSPLQRFPTTRAAIDPLLRGVGCFVAARTAAYNGLSLSASGSTRRAATSATPPDGSVPQLSESTFPSALAALRSAADVHPDLKQAVFTAGGLVEMQGALLLCLREGGVVDASCSVGESGRRTAVTPPSPLSGLDAVPEWCREAVPEITATIKLLALAFPDASLRCGLAKELVAVLRWPLLDAAAVVYDAVAVLSRLCEVDADAFVRLAAENGSIISGTYLALERTAALAAAPESTDIRATIACGRLSWLLARLAELEPGAIRTNILRRCGAESMSRLARSMDAVIGTALDSGESSSLDYPGGSATASLPALVVSNDWLALAANVALDPKVGAQLVRRTSLLRDLSLRIAAMQPCGDADEQQPSEACDETAVHRAELLIRSLVCVSNLTYYLSADGGPSDASASLCEALVPSLVAIVLPTRAISPPSVGDRSDFQRRLDANLEATRVLANLTHHAPSRQWCIGHDVDRVLETLIADPAIAARSGIDDRALFNCLGAMLNMTAAPQDVQQLAGKDDADADEEEGTAPSLWTRFLERVILLSDDTDGAADEEESGGPGEIAELARQLLHNVVEATSAGGA